MKMFCEECMATVEADVLVETEKTRVRGVDLVVDNAYPVCRQCGSRIADSAYMEANLERAYCAYREAEGIPSPEHLQGLRDAAGWSQRQLALLLGIGLASLQRYEAGSLPSKSHASILKRSQDPSYLRCRLREIAPALNERDRNDLSQGIDAVFGGGWDSDAYREAVLGFVPSSPSSLTGGASFSEAKLRETLAYLANSVESLYKTKLNKVLFYLDFSMWRDHGRGFTGLRYARATYGPVPDGYEKWMPAFVDGESLWYEESENGGQILRAGREADTALFSEEELSQLSLVVRYVNEFPTASALSEASHREDAWLKVGQGDLIDYSYAATLKGVR